MRTKLQRYSRVREKVSNCRQADQVLPCVIVVGSEQIAQVCLDLESAEWTVVSEVLLNHLVMLSESGFDCISEIVIEKGDRYESRGAVRLQLLNFSNRLTLIVVANDPAHETSKMRIVSNQSEEDMRRRETHEALVWPLRELTANLLRITNGAGKPLEFMRQLRACHEALRLYAEAHTNALPGDYEIQQILDCDRAWHQMAAEERRAEMAALNTRDDGEIEREMALGLVRKGVLQIVASRLLQQIPQEARGEHDWHSGIHMLEEANDKRRKYRAKNKKTLEETLAEIEAMTAKHSRKKKPPGGEPGGS
jgi:hypothetical protein